MSISNYGNDLIMENQIRSAQHFIASNRFGVLSTLSQTHIGYPFGSIVPYDITKNGEIIIYISLIAEHYRNLKKDPKASLIVIDPNGLSDPQAHARATILAEFFPVEDSERIGVQQSYEARFPNSINHEITQNFLFFRGRPKKIRWIAGFGDISWIDGDKFVVGDSDSKISSD